MMSITQIRSIHTYTPDQTEWDSLPRTCHMLAYQYGGSFIHTTEKKELITHTGSLLFLHKRDPYHVRALTTGDFMVVSFQAEDMPESFCLDCGSTPQIEQAFHRLYTYRHLHIPGNDYHCASVLYEVFAWIRHMQEVNGKDPDKTQKIRSVHAYIGEHYDDPALCTDALAEHCGISSKYMRTLFRTVYGTSPRQFLIQTRTQVAMRLLTGSDASIAQIAQAVGIPDVYYFSRLFKKQIGMTPQEYRLTGLENDEVKL